MSEYPLCECHGVPMKPAKGFRSGYRCRVKQREYDKKCSKHRNPRRVGYGNMYLGHAPRASQALALKQQMRDFAARQKERS